jgi:hypothetical protein
MKTGEFGRFDFVFNDVVGFGRSELLEVADVPTERPPDGEYPT